MAMTSIFLGNGFLVFPVFDPDWRHHTKKASIAPEFKRRRAFVEGIRAKAELMVVSRKLRQEIFTNDNTNERNTLLEKQKQLEKTVQSCDKSTNDVESLRRPLSRRFFTQRRQSAFT